MLVRQWVYFDYCSSALHFLEKLKELHNYETGTILSNRISHWKLINIHKVYHGTCIGHVTSDKYINIVELKDSNKIIMASSCCGT